MLRKLSCVAVALIFITAAAHADEPLGIVTGPKTGTYYAFGKDITDVAVKAGITMDVKPSEGSIENIKRINSAENAALGIVQSDVLGFLARSKNPDSMKMADHLRLIFPLYNEEVHVLVRNEINSFADLAGKKVAVGEDGSGNMLTSVNLFSMMDIAPKEQLKMPAAQAVVAVLKGEIDAAVFVGGKPVRLFKNLEDLTLPENQKYAPLLEQVHFLSMDNPKMLEEYKPAEILPTDYKFVKVRVPTIAVQSVLVSYDFSQHVNKSRCETLVKLAKLLRDSLSELREKGHPKWKEVDLEAPSGIWKKDDCVWPGDAKDGMSQELMNILEKK